MNSPKPICDKCRSEAPVNQELSNEDWIYYDMDKPCTCGGTFKSKLDELLSSGMAIASY